MCQGLGQKKHEKKIGNRPYASEHPLGHVVQEVDPLAVHGQAGDAPSDNNDNKNDNNNNNNNNSNSNSNSNNNNNNDSSNNNSNNNSNDNSTNIIS